MGRCQTLRPSSPRRRGSRKVHQVQHARAHSIPSSSACQCATCSLRGIVQPAYIGIGLAKIQVRQAHGLKPLPLREMSWCEGAATLAEWTPAVPAAAGGEIFSPKIFWHGLAPARVLRLFARRRSRARATCHAWSAVTGRCRPSPPALPQGARGAIDDPQASSAARGL